LLPETFRMNTDAFPLLFFSEFSLDQIPNSLLFGLLPKHHTTKSKCIIDEFGILLKHVFMLLKCPFQGGPQTANRITSPLLKESASQEGDEKLYLCQDFRSCGVYIVWMLLIVKDGRRMGDLRAQKYGFIERLGKNEEKQF